MSTASVDDPPAQVPRTEMAVVISSNIIQNDQGNFYVCIIK